MQPSMTVFDKTNDWYLERLSQCDFLKRATMLGVEPSGAALHVVLLGETFRISSDGVAAPNGESAPFSENIILFNYILRCPEQLPRKGGWITWREVPGSGPLSVYLGDNAVKPLEETFSGNIDALESVTKKFGGVVEPGSGCDFAATFELLPRIPLALRFNDGDDDFPPACTLLFTENVGSWLDTESLAILAVLFAQKLVLISDVATQG